tara:strand:+ start:1780 stop:2397 length:618 start_codon:yes stop_codon:yes gene_type:complete
MALINKVNDIEFYAVPNQHWVVSAFYPDYKDLEKFFDFTDIDISEKTATVNGLQRPIKNEEWAEERTKYMTWMLDTLKQVNIPVTAIKERQSKDQSGWNSAWTINYFPGGWQAGHFHSTDRSAQSNKRFISTVMFFDDINPTRDNRWNGCLYTLLQNPYGYTYDHKFHPKAGQVIIMDDRVWHGTYPTEDNRRVFVSDFDVDNEN